MASGSQQSPEEHAQPVNQGPPYDIIATMSTDGTVRDMVRREFARPPDRLVKTWAADENVNLVIAGPYRSGPVNIARRVLTRERLATSIDGTPVAQPFRIRRHDPVSSPGVRRTFERYDRYLKSVADQHRMRAPRVLTFNPLTAGFTPADWAAATVYYARDDWSVHPGYSQWHDRFRESYANLRSMQRPVIAVSQTILDRIEPTAPSLVVQNGINETEWATPHSAPDWFLALPEPRLLYLGTLDTRLDMDAVEDLAAAFNGGSIILAGHVDSSFPAERAAAVRNLHVRDHQKRRDIIGMTQHADLCLLTHNVTGLTKAMSPLKLYEYLGAGKPVISPDLPPVRGLHDHIHFYDQGDGSVVDAARQALTQGPMSEPVRQRFIDENTWRSRHQQVLNFLLGVGDAA